MAKVPTSVVGIDIGSRTLKGVALQKRGSRFVLTHYGIKDTDGNLQTTEQYVANIKALLAEMKVTAKAAAISIATPDTLLRIIEQPETDTKFLRSGLRINGPMMLNQDVKDYVLDCAEIPTTGPKDQSRVKYLVGGVKGSHITALHQASEKLGIKIQAVQISPVATFNAFEYAYEEVFQKEAFMIVDLRHTTSTICLGVRREVILVRTLEYGGKNLEEALLRAGEGTKDQLIAKLEAGDEVLTEAARISLAALTREISSSIGFFEGRREETIGKVFVSGGSAAARSILQIMAEELNMPCMAWNPLEKCEVQISDSKRSSLASDIVSLHAACGVAMDVLKS